MSVFFGINKEVLPLKVSRNAVSSFSVGMSYSFYGFLSGAGQEIPTSQPEIF